MTRATYCTTHRMKVAKDFDSTDIVEQHMGRIQLSGSGRYALRAQVLSRELFRIPDRFRHVF